MNFSARAAGLCAGSTCCHEATCRGRTALGPRPGPLTTVDAATAALKAGARRLVIGHYSSRYKEEGLLVDEAWALFPGDVPPPPKGHLYHRKGAMTKADIQLVRSLADKRGRAEHGLFPGRGEKLIGELRASHFRVRKIYARGLFHGCGGRDGHAARHGTPRS